MSIQTSIRDLNSLWEPVGNKDTVECFTLGDLWDQYYEWSVFGLGVPIQLTSGETVVQYYVPHLSAIQIYTRKILMSSRYHCGSLAFKSVIFFLVTFWAVYYWVSFDNFVSGVLEKTARAILGVMIAKARSCLSHGMLHRRTLPLNQMGCGRQRTALGNYIYSMSSTALLMEGYRSLKRYKLWFVCSFSNWVGVIICLFLFQSGCICRQLYVETCFRSTLRLFLHFILCLLGDRIGKNVSGFDIFQERGTFPCKLDVNFMVWKSFWILWIFKNMRVFIIEDSGIIYYDQHWSTANAFVLLILHICFCCWKRDLLHVRLLLFHFWWVNDLFFLLCLVPYLSYSGSEKCEGFGFFSDLPYYFIILPRYVLDKICGNENLFSCIFTGH